ncbi:MAG: DUF859 domain-containing protein [Bacteroidales bacterium]|nr:DUF859 domain-containing protein [Bacteroidales bacterium]
MMTVGFVSPVMVGHQEILSNGAYTTFQMTKSGSFPSTQISVKSVTMTINLRNAGWDTINVYAGSTLVGSMNAAGEDGIRTLQLSTGYNWKKLSTIKICGGDQGTQLESGSYVTVSVAYDYVAATVLLDKNDVYAGQYVSVSMGNVSDGHTYRLDILHGDTVIKSEAMAGNAQMQEALFIQVPVAWCNYIPDAEQGTFVFRLSTYTGSTLSGTSEASLTVRVPLLAGPVAIPSYSIALNEPVLGLQYVQGMSQLRLDMSARGAYGASIRAFDIVFGSYHVIVEAAENEAELVLECDQAGMIPLQVRSIDSRGRTSGAAEHTVNVAPYTDPTIQSVTCERCDADGNADPEGQRMTVQVGYQYAEIGTNSAVMSIVAFEYGSSTGVTLYTGEAMSGTVIGPMGAGNLDKTKQYAIRVTVTDGLDHEAMAIAQLPAGEVFIRMDAEHKRIGFGTYPQMTGKGVEFAEDWELKTHGREIIDLIDSRIPEPVQPPEPEHWHFGSVNIDSAGTLATNTTQSYSASVEVPEGAEVQIIGQSILYGSRIAFWGRTGLSVDGTTATFTITVRNDGGNATSVRATIYYCYKE